MTLTSTPVHLIPFEFYYRFLCHTSGTAKSVKSLNTSQLSFLCLVKGWAGNTAVLLHVYVILPTVFWDYVIGLHISP